MKEMLHKVPRRATELIEGPIGLHRSNKQMWSKNITDWTIEWGGGEIGVSGY